MRLNYNISKLVYCWDTTTDLEVPNNIILVVDSSDSPDDTEVNLKYNYCKELTLQEKIHKQTIIRNGSRILHGLSDQRTN